MKHQALVKRKSEFGASETPNPSIEATNSGAQRLRAFAKAVPPLFAPHPHR
jgi:hypothetical protein